MNKRKKHSITILIIVLMIVLLSAVGCTSKQEYVLQYLDTNQELVTEIYKSIDSVNTRTLHFDSIGIKYWVD